MWFYKENWTDSQTRAERDEEKREKTTPKKSQEYHDFVGYYEEDD